MLKTEDGGSVLDPWGADGTLPFDPWDMFIDDGHGIRENFVLNRAAGDGRSSIPDNIVRNLASANSHSERRADVR